MRPPYIGPYGDGFPGCLLVLPSLLWVSLRRLLLDLWDNADAMADPECYGWGDD
jgi:hypothetical protein